MNKALQAAGVGIWIFAVVMAINALIVPGNLPQGFAWRGLSWLTTAAFAWLVIFRLIWSKAKGHWTSFGAMCLFFAYCSLLYFTSITGISAQTKHLITVGFTCCPLVALLLTRAYLKSIKKDQGRKQRCIKA